MPTRTLEIWPCDGCGQALEFWCADGPVPEGWPRGPGALAWACSPECDERNKEAIRAKASARWQRWREEQG
jgi:hypothetical protein